MESRGSERFLGFWGISVSSLDREGKLTHSSFLFTEASPKYSLETGKTKFGFAMF